MLTSPVLLAMWFPANEDNGVDATVTVFRVDEGGDSEPVAMVLGVDELEDATAGLADEGFRLVGEWTASKRGTWWQVVVERV